MAGKLLSFFGSEYGSDPMLRVEIVSPGTTADTTEHLPFMRQCHTSNIVIEAIVTSSC